MSYSSGFHVAWRVAARRMSSRAWARHTGSDRHTSRVNASGLRVFIHCVMKAFQSVTDDRNFRQSPGLTMFST
ncbi:MAG: hypothetical protein BWX70_02171 [Verrucomicrobia bacterium ADurb.Bin070]|nr:MAG: hypothetical protein BWX70_02171 [Verrucomicrobia bacterium ADurb.Bin070]